LVCGGSQILHFDLWKEKEGEDEGGGSLERGKLTKVNNVSNKRTVPCETEAGGKEGEVKSPTVVEKHSFGAILNYGRTRVFYTRGRKQERGVVYPSIQTIATKRKKCVNLCRSRTSGAWQS